MLVDELMEFFKRLERVREDIGFVLLVFLDLDRPIADAIVNPIRADLQASGYLVWAQEAWNEVWLAV